MPEAVLHTDHFNEGFDITRTTKELRIQATDYHARPLRLDTEALPSFGLRFDPDQHYIEVKENEDPKGITDRILASQDKAIKLMLRQRKKASWRWDIQNLNRAWIAIGGLDVEGVGLRPVTPAKQVAFHKLYHRPAAED